jgi:FKBP-type peptidyl-prolyl cis-trans isomerase 2
MIIAKENSVAALEFRLEWKSEAARHSERFFARRVNFWRDLFPEEAIDLLEGKKAGEVIPLEIPAEQVFPYEPDKRLVLNTSQFERRRLNGNILHPRFGRFYPAGLLRGVSNTFSATMQPFRCVGIGSSDLEVDLNHPLAGKDLRLEIRVHDVRQKTREIGGQMTDWLETVSNGPGMQARWNDEPTDFFSSDPFARLDTSNDRRFYERPRLVTHVDDQALEHIQSLYAGLLEPGMDVLDLMSSWRSHVSETFKLNSLVGLGLNEEELKNNPQLSSYVVHDLNESPNLPFDDQSFDAVICAASVEYLVRPFDVFLDCARILKPNGVLIQTFSNRWFPPKVISIWEELSEFERVGLVLEYFLRSGAYEGIETVSMRGWPRPVTDQYYPHVRMADPIYAVAGRRKQRIG